ncbi:MAG: DUF349 domain-containing protein [Prevotellaceae bacterium]|jgi:hypothetical protein|nr:DUF349 domain-containing protein [Prevotellaceae bacterium]
MTEQDIQTKEIEMSEAAAEPQQAPAAAPEESAEPQQEPAAAPEESAEDAEAQSAALLDELQMAEPEEEGAEEALAEPEEGAAAEPLAEPAKPDGAYSGLDREALLQALAKLLEEKPAQEFKGEVEAIKAAFFVKLAQKREAQRREFVHQGGSTADFAMPEDSLEVRLKELLAKYKKMRSELAAQQEKEREENLKQKLSLIEALKQLLDRQDDFNKVFNDFKQIQSRWHAIGPAPQPKQKEVWEVYSYNVEKFYDVVKINKELRELDFKKNFELKQLLCEKTEELLLEDNVVKAFRELQKFHEQWRDIGPVAVEFREPLWERFKNATTQVNKKYQDYYELQKVEQQRNLEMKLVLCEKAEELLAAPVEHAKEWGDKTQQLLDLQRMWKAIGAAPRKESNKVFHRFRSACSAFFDNRSSFFDEQKTASHRNLQQKLDLCAQAELLSDSSDWRKATDELVQLQAQWKTIGAVSQHRQSDIAWRRFRAACNKFFDRKKEHFATQDARYDENSKKKAELIAEIKSYVPGSNPKDSLAAIKEFQQRWTEIGFVPMKQKDNLQQDYRVAIDALFEGLHVSGADRQHTSFKVRIASAPEGGDRRHMSQELERLTQQLKRLEADIKLWDNNINFFARSKNAEKIIQDINANIEQARQEAKAVQEKIKQLADNSDKKA